MPKRRGMVWGRPIVDRQLRAVLDGAADGVLIECDERIVYLNTAYARMLVLTGRRSKEIALLLNVSEKTIFTHRSRAFRKLALRGERDLFRLAAELKAVASSQETVGSSQ